MTDSPYDKIVNGYKEVKGKLENLDRNTQMHLNSWTDGCYIRFLTADEFDADAGNHYDEQISIVLRDSVLELWKGDVRIHLTGKPGDTSLQLLVANL